MSLLMFEDTNVMMEDTELTVESSVPKVKAKIFKCPCCGKKYINKACLYTHVYDAHGDMMPENMSAAQFTFNLRNKKQFGICVQCRTNHTKWNEEAERYERFCSEECKNKYVLEAKSRMIKKYGKEHLLNDPEVQERMQDARSIGGKYKFISDGTEVPYLGSYEKDFLEYLDEMRGINGKDVMRCPETFTYEYEGKDHMYMPDYYLPNFNLIVEIKDGGDNPNMHHKIQEVDKVKEKLKDEAMRNQTKFNYIKVVNKEYKLLEYGLQCIIDNAWDDPSFKGVCDPLILIP